VNETFSKKPTGKGGSREGGGRLLLALKEILKEEKSLSCAQGDPLEGKKRENNRGQTKNFYFKKVARNAPGEPSRKRGRGVVAGRRRGKGGTGRGGKRIFVLSFEESGGG